MKKFSFYAMIVLAMLLAACSTSSNQFTSSQPSIQISAENLENGATVPEFSMVQFSATITGADSRLEWSVNSSEARLIDNDSRNDPYNYTVSVLVPSADIATLVVTATDTATNTQESFSLNVRANQSDRRIVFTTSPSILIPNKATSRVLEARVLNAKNQPVDAAITFTSSNPQAISVTADTAQNATVHVLSNEASSAVITARYDGLEATTVVVFATLAEGAYYVAADAIQSANANQVTLSRNAATEALAVGDVVVSDGAYGLGDRITALEVQDNTVVLTVENARPEHIYDSISTDVQVPVAHIEAKLVGDGNGIVTSYSPNGELMGQTLIDGSTCTTADGTNTELALEGTDITLKTDVVSDFQYEASRYYGTTKFKLVLKTTTDLKITSGKMTFNNASGKEISCTVDLGVSEVPVTQISPFCVGIYYQANIALAAKGTHADNKLVVENAFTANFKNTAEVGVNYTYNDGWKSISQVDEAGIEHTYNASADKVDVSKNFTHYVRGSANHKFAVKIYKGSYVCCYYYYNGCYYRYYRYVTRKVAFFDFAKLSSSAFLDAENKVVANSGGDNGGGTNPYPGGGDDTKKCNTLTWKVGFNHTGALADSLATNHDRYSFNYFTRNILCIRDTVSAGQHSYEKLFDGTIKGECKPSSGNPPIIYIVDNNS